MENEVEFLEALLKELENTYGVIFKRLKKLKIKLNQKRAEEALSKK